MVNKNNGEPKLLRRVSTKAALGIVDIIALLTVSIFMLLYCACVWGLDGCDRGRGVGNPSDPWPEIAWHNAAGAAERRMHNIYGLCQVVLEELQGTPAAEVQIGWVKAVKFREPTPPHPKSEV